MNRLCILAHYDKDNQVDDYVFYLVENLKKVSSRIIFVTTSQINASEAQKLEKLCNTVIARENIGYDFVSWQTGLNSLSNIGDFDELIICNDSVYGPLYPLKDIFYGMRKNDCDFWGMTQSNQIDYHLQSYFMVFRKNVINSKAFADFWNSVQAEPDKKEIIKKYEVGLTQTLIPAGFKPCAYALNPPHLTKSLIYLISYILRNPLRTINKLPAFLKKREMKNYLRINPSHFLWKELIIKYRMPFIKIELLRNNPTNINIKDVEDVIKNYTNYDVNLIKKHLERMATSNKLD